MERFTLLDFLRGLPLAVPFAAASVLLLRAHRGGRLVRALEFLAAVVGLSVAAHLLSLPGKPVVGAWAILICAYFLIKGWRDGDFG